MTSHDEGAGEAQPPRKGPTPRTQTATQNGRGRLKHGNPPGDLSTVQRCGAKTRRGTRCEGPAMPNGRCRMHGGCSTGPRTAEGLARSKRARWKHGRYSQERRREAHQLKSECAAFNAAIRTQLTMLRASSFPTTTRSNRKRGLASGVRSGRRGPFLVHDLPATGRSE